MGIIPTRTGFFIKSWFQYMSQYVSPSQILAVEWGETHYSDFFHENANFP